MGSSTWQAWYGSGRRNLPTSARVLLPFVVALHSSRLLSTSLATIGTFLAALHTTLIAALSRLLQSTLDGRPACVSNPLLFTPHPTLKPPSPLCCAAQGWGQVPRRLLYPLPRIHPTQYLKRHSPGSTDFDDDAVILKGSCMALATKFDAIAIVFYVFMALSLPNLLAQVLVLRDAVRQQDPLKTRICAVSAFATAVVSTSV